MKAVLLVMILSLTGCAHFVERVAESAVDAYISGSGHDEDLSKAVNKCVVKKTCQKK